MILGLGLDAASAVEHDAATMQSPKGGGSTPRLGGAISTFYFASFAALGIYAPYFPLWLEAHGFIGVRMSLIAALSPAMSFFGPPIVGTIADARGARGNLLSAACALSCSAMAALCLGEAMGLSRAFGVVFGAVLVYAACRTPIIMLADRIALEHGGNYGRRRVWGSVGFLVAVSVFGGLCPPELWRWLPGLVAALLACAFATSLPLPRATAAPERPALDRAGGLLQRRSFVVFLVCSGTFAAGHASYELCGSLLFRDLGASGDTIGLLWACSVLSEILLLVGAGNALRQVRPELLLALAYAGGAVRWLLMSLLSSTDLAFPLQPLHAISFGLVWLASLEYVRRSSAPHTLGSAQGLFMAATAAGGVLGMLTWGPLYAAQGAASVFRCAAVLSAGAAALAYGSLYRTARASAAPG